ncbi:MAG: tetratricopeptide repeat protein [Planctomycetes bacterium]|nr:tetratricopeptide repeat protein [Planctomycetota bacterium]
MPSAETAYLFRHALLRDAAYDLHLPQDRARLHGLALALLEGVLQSSRPQGDSDQADAWTADPQPIDAFALELAHHARLAQPIAGEKATAAREWYTARAADYAERHYRHGHALELWHELAETSQGSAKGRAKRRAAEMEHMAGSSENAQRLLDEALGLLQQTGELQQQALTLDTLGRVHRGNGRTREAEHAFEQALAIHRRTGNRRGEGSTLANLAALFHQSGRVDRAEQCYEQSLQLVRGEDSQLESVVQGNLAAIYNETGRSDAAEQLYEQALAALRAAGNRLLEGMLLGNLAVVYAHTGRADRAVAAYERALAIHQEVGNRRSESVVRANLAVRHREAGRLEQSEAAYQRALAMLRETANRPHEAAHTCGYAVCLLRLGRPEQARHEWARGAAMLREMGDSAALAQCTEEMHRECAKIGAPPFDTTDCPGSGAPATS